MSPLKQLVELWNGQCWPSEYLARQEVVLYVVAVVSTEDPLASASSERPVFLPFVPEPTLQIESQIHLTLVEAGNPGLGLSSQDFLSTVVLYSSGTAWPVS